MSHIRTKTESTMLGLLISYRMRNHDMIIGVLLE